MSKQQKWGLRVAGIREGGALYPTWEAAKEALYKRVDSLHYEAQRKGYSWADEIGRRKGQLLAEMINAKKQRPRPALRLNVPYKAGYIRSYAITREPF
jgi:hypothetical protein